MLDALRFVAAAIPKKDFVQPLTHFQIVDGRVTGFNGVITLSSDIDIDLDVRPKAASFLTAVKACPGIISLNVTPGGRLAVKSERFKSFIDCLPVEESIPFMQPEGREVEVGENFLKGLKALSPIIGIDASRPWTMGVKLQNQSMFATNNVMLAEFWHGTEIPIDVIIPDIAVEQLIRLDEPPTKIQVTETSISFWFGEKRWLRSNLRDGSWPTEHITRLFEKAANKAQPITEEFTEGIETIKNFLGERGIVYVTPTSLMTSLNEGEGTIIEINPLDAPPVQVYHHKQLLLLTEVATTVDWLAYPNPACFYGERLRGVLVGQRI